MPKVANKISIRMPSGLASIIIVSIIVTLLGLTSIGFVRLVNQEQRKSLSAQQASTAYYGAQSGISSAVTYLKNHPGENLNTGCTDLFDTIKPDLGNGIKITCLKVKSDPTSTFETSELEPYKSIVVNYNASPGVAPISPVSRFDISWESVPENTHHTYINPPTITPQLSEFPQVDNLPTEEHWENNDYGTLLRLTLYPVRDDNIPSPSETRTYFFKPTLSTDRNLAPAIFSYGDTSLIDRPVTAKCFNTAPQGKYDCNIAITDIPTVAPGGFNSYWLRFTPLYNPAKANIVAYDKDGNITSLSNSLATIDATAKSGSASKRLQAIVHTNGGSSTVTTIKNIPEYALRSASTLCKDFRWRGPNDRGNIPTLQGEAREYCWSQIYSLRKD